MMMVVKNVVAMVKAVVNNITMIIYGDKDDKGDYCDDMWLR